MTTRGTMALICLCVLSACLLVMTTSSSVRSGRQPVRSDRLQSVADAREAVQSPNGFQPPGAITRTIPPFPALTQHPANIDDEPQPGRLPSAKHAAPLIADAGQIAALRDLIRREMPHASPAEIDVWVRKFQGMPLSSVRTMLEMRRLVPIRPRTNEPQPFVSQPLPVPNTPRVVGPPDAYGPTQPSRVGPNRPRLTPVPTSEPSPLDPSLAALQQARNVVLHNIANAATPGFKRCRVLFGERGEPGNAGNPSGVQIAVVQKDWSPGKLSETGRKLDFAVAGAGFFIVRRGEQRALTRNGNFERNADGTLVMAADRRWRVETGSASGVDKQRNKVTFSFGVRTAPFQLPNRKRGLELPVLPGVLAPFAHAGVDLKVQHTGHTSAPKRTGSSAGPRLATVPNPDGLQPLGHGLFAATPSSGPLKLRSPNAATAGTIRSGCLEASNVDTNRELAELKKIAGQIQALRMAEAMMQETGPKPAPPRPIVEKPALRRMSDSSPRHLKFDAEVWFDRLFHSSKYREIKRNLGMYDHEPEEAPAPTKPQPMAPPPKLTRPGNSVVPAGFDELDSWEYPVEIEVLFFWHPASERSAG